MNLRDVCVEVHRHADRERRVYQESRTVRRGDTLEPLALTGPSVRAADLLPPGLTLQTS